MAITDDELKNLLLKNNLIDQNGLKQIEEYVVNTGGSFYDALIERNITTDEKLGLIIADYLKVPFVVLSKISIPLLT